MSFFRFLLDISPSFIDNKHVQKAEDVYEYLNGDEAKKRIAYLREKRIRDEVEKLSH